MIKILQFSSLINRYDFIDNLVRSVDPRRFQVSVCVRSNESNIAAPEYKTETLFRDLNLASRRESIHVVMRIARLLREWQVDILHAHHYEQAVIGWLATKLYPKTRLIVGRHYSDAIYRLTSATKRKALLGLEQLINRSAARIIVPSHHIFEILTERQGINAAKIDLIPYGFAPAKYLPPASEEIDRLRRELNLEGRFVIGNLSRLHEEKGHHYLIEAVRQLKDERPELLVLLVGEGPARHAIERKIVDAGVTKMVKLLGWRKDAMTVMSVVDAVAQSTLQEAFSQVMVEALWMSKPLVMTDVSGARDVVSDGQNGLIVPAGDSAALAQAINRLAGDMNLRNRLAAAGRESVEKNLVMDRIIGLYEKSYLQAMSSGRDA